MIPKLIRDFRFRRKVRVWEKLIAELSPEDSARLNARMRALRDGMRGRQGR